MTGSSSTLHAHALPGQRDVGTVERQAWCLARMDTNFGKYANLLDSRHLQEDLGPI